MMEPISAQDLKVAVIDERGFFSASALAKDIRAWCSKNPEASILEIKIVSGAPEATAWDNVFLVRHHAILIYK